MCFGCLPTSAPKKEYNLCLTPGTKQVWAYFLRWYEPTFKYCTFGQHNTPWFDRKPSPRARAAGAERSRTPLLRLDTPGIWNQLSALTSSPVATTREGLLQPHTHVWLRRCLGYLRKSGDRQTLSPSLITLLTVALAVFFFKAFFLLAHRCPKCSRHFKFFIQTMCIFTLTCQDRTGSS